MAIEQEIITWLEMRSVNLNIQHVAGRKALLIAAGLGDLQNAVNLEGATLVFCRNMLEYLAHYGQMADGGDPVIALLETAKSLVGVNYQAECAALMQRWQAAPPSERLPLAPRPYYGGVSEARFEALVEELAVTKSALKSFFKILEQEQVPREDLDSTLREIAKQYKELLQRLEVAQSEDPQVAALKTQARQAIEDGQFDDAEKFLNDAEARDIAAIEQLETAAKQRRMSAAEINTNNACVQCIQFRYAESAAYWQQAAQLLPEEEQQKRAEYLNAAGNDFYRIGRYAESLKLYEQSLAIRRKIGDKASEEVTLNNIGLIYNHQGDFAAALQYYEQSLAIRREISDKVGEEGTTLLNIGATHYAQGDFAKALSFCMNRV